MGKLFKNKLLRNTHRSPDETIKRVKEIVASYEIEEKGTSTSFHPPHPVRIYTIQDGKGL
jgi:hypothetical protein